MSRFFSFVSILSHLAHTHRGCHRHAFMNCATLFDLALPFYLTHLLSHSVHFFPHLKLEDHNLLHTPHKESTDLTLRVLPPHRTRRKSSVRELVKKIESHPHRKDLRDDLQQNNAYNPFGEKSKKMIKDMGNVGLFKLFETIPKVQRSECLFYWTQGIVHCTCGHLLRENQSSRRIHRWQLDLLSIPTISSRWATSSS